MSILVWTMVGIAIWHFAVLVPDKFVGGIIGALLAALMGAVAAGYALPAPGLPTGNPPGIQEAVFAVPGAVGALALSYWYGARQEARSSGCTSSPTAS